MDPAALVAFYVKVPSRVTTVEVLGSWDNFSQPFQGIIFDGDQAAWSRPRHGSLKQGGRYWYFFRLDDIEEFCDERQDTANDCPLLPGQRMNFIEMPMEVVRTPPHARSVSTNTMASPAPTMTLDPHDRYVSPVRQSPTRALRKHSSIADLASKVQLPSPTDEDLPSMQTPAKSPTRSIFSWNSKGPVRPITPYDRSTSSPSTSPASSPRPRSWTPPHTISHEGVRPQTRPGSDYQSCSSSLDMLRHGDMACSPGLGIAMGQAHQIQPAPIISRPQLFKSHSDSSAASEWPIHQSESSSSSFASPTFTADTVSSTGFETPDRHSADLFGHTHLDVVGDEESQMMSELNDVGRRFSRLQTGTGTDEMLSSPVTSSGGRLQAPPPLMILRNSTAAASDLTLKKLPTPSESTFPDGALKFPGPTVTSPVTDMTSPSLASQIFGELGFLGRAII